MSLNSVLLLLLVNFVSEFRLELMYISLIVQSIKFRQASNLCKRVLEAAKFAYATKFCHSADQSGCLLHLIKQIYFLKTFLRTLSLMALVSLYLFSLLELM